MPASGAAFHAVLAPISPGTRALAFAAEADARVEQTQPGSNFGTSNTLRMDQATGRAEDVDTYMRFAVAGLTGRVASAKLRLRSTGNTIHGVAVHTAAGGWTETGINWSNRPASASAPIAQVNSIDTQQWVEWDVTQAVTGDGPVDLRLTPTGDDGITFHSREASNQTLRPQLVVTVVNDGYARPKGAAVTRLSLVPAFKECTSPNRTHGLPLGQPSCSPPAQASSELTVGTSDANGATSNSVGTATFKVVPGTPSTPADEADVQLQVSITDVRRRTGPGRLHRVPAGTHHDAHHRPGRRWHLHPRGPRSARGRAVCRDSGRDRLDLLDRHHARRPQPGHDRRGRPRGLGAALRRAARQRSGRKPGHAGQHGFRPARHLRSVARPARIYPRSQRDMKLT